MSVTGPVISSSLSPGTESIYHSAQTVRLNKKLQNISPPTPQLHHAGIGSQQQQQQQHGVYTHDPLYGPQHMYMSHNDARPCDPIDEAVRLLEHSAAMLQ